MAGGILYGAIVKPLILGRTFFFELNVVIHCNVVLHIN